MNTKEKTTMPETETNDPVVKSKATTDNSKEKAKFKIPPVIAKLPFKLKIILLISAVALVVVLFVAIGSGGKSSMKTISKSSLQEILEISELSTVEYTYNAIATKKEKDKDLYYVAYEGEVKAGIEFDKIDINISEEEKKIILKIPEIHIQEWTVNMGTLEYIFTKSKYETEDVSQEAYKLCKEDLKKRVESDNVLFDMAKENAVSTVEALFKPWIDTIDDSYTIVIE